MGAVNSTAQKILSVTNDIVSTAGPIIENLLPLFSMLNNKDEKKITASTIDLKLCLYEIGITKSICNTEFQNHYKVDNDHSIDGKECAIIYTLLQMISNILSLLKLEVIYSQGNVIDIGDNFPTYMGYLLGIRNSLKIVLVSNPKYDIKVCLPNPVNIIGVSPIVLNTSNILEQLTKIPYDNTKWFKSDIFSLICPNQDDILVIFDIGREIKRNVGIKFPINATYLFSKVSRGFVSGLYQTRLNDEKVYVVSTDYNPNDLDLDVLNISQNIITLMIKILGRTFWFDFDFRYDAIFYLQYDTVDTFKLEYSTTRKILKPETTKNQDDEKSK